MTEINKKQTLGYFDIVGYINVDSKTFSIQTPSKNNPNWVMNNFNPKVEGDNGESLYIRISDGYDIVKGKKIFAISKEKNSLEISFADRHNENMLDLVDDLSFIKVGIDKKTATNKQGKEYKTWEFNKFLTAFDAIQFLNQIMPLATKNKVRMTGTIKYSEYNGETQRNFDLQSIYLLNGNEDEGKEMECKFNFTQNILIDKNSVDMTAWEEGISKLNARVHVKKKKDVFQALPLQFIMRAETPEKKATIEKMIKRFFTVENDTVRRLNIEGYFKSGYIVANVKEEDLNDEARDLIDSGLYTLDEVLGMFANRDRVDELLLRRPVMKKMQDQKMPKIDMADEEFTLEYLDSLLVNDSVTENMADDIESEDEFLNELENL